MVSVISLRHDTHDYSPKSLMTRVLKELEWILTGKSVFTTSPSSTSNRFCSGLPRLRLIKNVESYKNSRFQTIPTLYALCNFSRHPRVQFDSNDFFRFLEYLDCQIARPRAYFKNNLLLISIDFDYQFAKQWS